jgi:protein-tyrosine-phosphatase
MMADLPLRLRALLSDLKHWPDRRAHDARRADAIARLARLGAPRGVLVMCLGNICRSPYAEYRLRQMLADTPLSTMQVRSAGLIGPGRPSPAFAQDVAAARGIRLDRHVSRTLAPEVLAGMDLVLVMATSQADALRGRVGVPRERIFVLGDFDPEPIARREIPDPYGGEREAFEASYERIDRCLAAFTAALIPPR